VTRPPELYAIYFRPKRWRGKWTLEQVVPSFAESYSIARRIEDRYPNGEHAAFVIPPRAPAPEHFTDGSEPGRLFRQTTCAYAVYIRRQLQARLAT